MMRPLIDRLLFATLAGALCAMAIGCEDNATPPADEAATPGSEAAGASGPDELEAEAEGQAGGAADAVPLDAVAERELTETPTRQWQTVGAAEAEPLYNDSGVRKRPVWVFPERERALLVSYEPEDPTGFDCVLVDAGGKRLAEIDGCKGYTPDDRQRTGGGALIALTSAEGGPGVLRLDDGTFHQPKVPQGFEAMVLLDQVGNDAWVVARDPEAGRIVYGRIDPALDQPPTLHELAAEHAQGLAFAAEQFAVDADASRLIAWGEDLGECGALALAADGDVGCAREVDASVEARMLTADWAFRDEGSHGELYAIDSPAVHQLTARRCSPVLQAMLIKPVERFAYTCRLGHIVAGGIWSPTRRYEIPYKDVQRLQEFARPDIGVRRFAVLGHDRKATMTFVLDLADQVYMRAGVASLVDDGDGWALGLGAGGQMRGIDLVEGSFEVLAPPKCDGQLQVLDAHDRRFLVGCAPKIDEQMGGKAIGRVGADDWRAVYDFAHARRIDVPADASRFLDAGRVLTEANGADDPVGLVTLPPPGAGAQKAAETK